MTKIAMTMFEQFQEFNMNTRAVIRKADSELGIDIQVGVVTYIKAPHESGWRFIPWLPHRRSSRKLWETPEAAIPRWVGKFELSQYTKDGS